MSAPSFVVWNLHRWRKSFGSVALFDLERQCWWWSHCRGTSTGVTDCQDLRKASSNIFQPFLWNSRHWELLGASKLQKNGRNETSFHIFPPSFGLNLGCATAFPQVALALPGPSPAASPSQSLALLDVRALEPDTWKPWKLSSRCRCIMIYTDTIWCRWCRWYSETDTDIADIQVICYMIQLMMHLLIHLLIHVCVLRRPGLHGASKAGYPDTIGVD